MIFSQFLIPTSQKCRFGRKPIRINRILPHNLITHDRKARHAALWFSCPWVLHFCLGPSSSHWLFSKHRILCEFLEATFWILHRRISPRQFPFVEGYHREHAYLAIVSILTWASRFSAIARASRGGTALPIWLYWQRCFSSVRPSRASNL